MHLRASLPHPQKRFDRSAMQVPRVCMHNLRNQQHMTRPDSGTPAIDRALHDIDELENDGDITESMAQRARDAVGLLFDADTCYACIGPIDDGDVSFYWVGGKWSVSIDLGADGSTWWRAVKSIDAVKSTTTGAAMEPLLRRALADFSEYVQSANPAWREMPR